ncbi:MAG: flagellar export chaperone FliS [Burkholderiaceae bacterium]|nr:flagellar export chaperone FliS [Burkholderiaceae bacterium]
MFAPYRSHASAYRQVDVETSLEDASPHRMIEMLYDGSIAAIRRAIAAIARGDVAARGEAVGRAIRIIDEGLKASLDSRAGEVAERLRSLYDYIGRRLLAGSMNNDARALEEAIDLIDELRDAWSQIAPQSRQAYAQPGRR